MLTAIKGTVVRRTEESCWLEVGGFTLEIMMPVRLLSQLVEGQTTSLLTHFQVREDQWNLFGFMTEEDRVLFQALLKVNGIGPKMAIKIMSTVSGREIWSWIEAADVDRLMSLPKLGKKTAETLILTLKGQLPKWTQDAIANEGLPPMTKTQTDVRSALLHLGFSGVEVDEAIRLIDPEADFNEAMRTSLRRFDREAQV